MKDALLLPYILPNIFSISTVLPPSQFASLVLPSLKPLFAIKEPPQNMLTLLDNLSMLQSKTDQRVFRERESWISVALTASFSLTNTEVLPLVYNALESEHSAVCARPFLK
jgi:SCY1-like protein 2